VATSKKTTDNIKAIQQQLQMEGEGDTEINSLLGNLRITNEGIETRNLEIVSELINEAGDDRNNLMTGDQVILVVEDDLRFSKIIIERAHQGGLKAIVATNYLEVFDFINRFNPIAITLDVKLPETSGWKVIDLLRNDLNYRHIPIHVISGEENRVLALKRGARSFMLKPIDNESLDELFNDILKFSKRTIKNVLVIEDNEIDSSQIAKILDEDNINVSIAPTGEKALEEISNNEYDCIILDYTLPDISGIDLVQKVSKAKQKLTPVIIYSAKDFNRQELAQINLNSNAVLLKGVNSIEHLLEEVVTHLHIAHKELPQEKRRIIESIRSKEDILTGKTVLVVDDDVRNLFALTTVFERFNINVITAESGKEAIQILNDNQKVEMVLMDIMMPEMDGYETTSKIRREHKNSTLPIIAVTAKAMKGDRQKCIEAGASDYITKPVKIDQLLSLMRLWFCK
jgi:CheY-like chemotaxis protein